MTTVIDVLRERGLIEAETDKEIAHLLSAPTSVYCGFDPTADSLHLGNLVAIIVMAWFKKFGHTVVAIVGGATGMIGDPSGKSSERQFLDEQTLENNLNGIRKNLETILDANDAPGCFLLLNNYDWFKDFSLIRFLREIGPLFRIGTMMAKDSVRARLQSEEGMSFTEFSYQTLQGYDFLHLFETHGVKIQLGGSDQWGNITAGIDLIRKVLGKQAFGLTIPLLTKSDGQKFGKSEKGAIWLSPEKLSPFEFYQYLLRVEDVDVIRLLSMLTFVPMEEIRAIEKKLQAGTATPREAQKRLAAEVTRIVHGEEALQTAMRVTEGLLPGSKTELNAALLESLSADMPSCTLPRHSVVGAKVIDLLVEIGAQKSKSDARRLIRNGGVYMNNKQVEDEALVVDENMLIEERLILISTGKKNKILVRVE